MGASTLRVSGLYDGPSSELETLKARITLLESRLVDEGVNLEEEGLTDSVRFEKGAQDTTQESEIVKFNSDGQDTRLESLETSENRPESAVSEAQSNE